VGDDRSLASDAGVKYTQKFFRSIPCAREDGNSAVLVRGLRIATGTPYLRELGILGS
jgi:hypothetical protein